MADSTILHAAIHNWSKIIPVGKIPRNLPVVGSSVARDKLGTPILLILREVQKEGWRRK